MNMLVFFLPLPQRLQFDVTSPNGVLLFREASKTIVSYGDRILTMTEIPQDKIYQLKYPETHYNNLIYITGILIKNAE